MKPTISATRTDALDEDDLSQVGDLSFTSVIADMAHSERRAYRQPKPSRPANPKRSQPADLSRPADVKLNRPAELKPSRPEIDLESTHTDRTINEMLAGTFANDEPDPSRELRMLPGGTMKPEAGDATEDLLSPDVLFPELTLK